MRRAISARSAARHRRAELGLARGLDRLVDGELRLAAEAARRDRAAGHEAEAHAAYLPPHGAHRRRVAAAGAGDEDAVGDQREAPGRGRCRRRSSAMIVSAPAGSPRRRGRRSRRPRRCRAARRRRRRRCCRGLGVGRVGHRIGPVIAAVERRARAPVGVDGERGRPGWAGAPAAVEAAAGDQRARAASVTGASESPPASGTDRSARRSMIEAVRG